ncbi:hypothetical protein [Bacillus toyonensis]|uniref:hypothetical protein n=1 Tax=Bacillus toyonensis TaxID=155322 RepID=UPI001E4C7503|nr:hypothetical protein [Bacillus toyonensis]MEC2352011.1 hypothetical protein [Bacillus toyonensis]
MNKISERSNHIIQIKPWEDKDLDLLFHINTPVMMQHPLRISIGTFTLSLQLTIQLQIQFVGSLDLN